MSSSPERLRDQWPVLLLWLVVTAGVFYYCVEDDRLDDLAGWIPVIVVIQLPAMPAAAHAAADPPAALPPGLAIAFTISLALAVAYVVFVLFTLLGGLIWKPAFLELRPVFLGFCLGLAALVMALVHGLRRHRKLPHPAALRRSLLDLLALCGVLWLVTAVLFPLVSLKEAVWLAVAMPLFWMAPLWLLLPRRPAPPRAVVR